MKEVMVESGQAGEFQVSFLCGCLVREEHSQLGRIQEDNLFNSFGTREK